MVYISRVYTKFGDAGDTMLASGDTVRKTDPRVHAYGEIDELNATIGLVRAEIAREPRRERAADFLRHLDTVLARIQQELFDLGAELATPGAHTGGSKLTIEDAHVEALERDLDALNEPLAPLRSFILPGGGPVACAAHLARTVCRRAERSLVALLDAQPVRPQTERYVNRLADLLFVVSRAAAHALGDDEVLWTPGASRSP
jgi:cob(I)alamin adenosyltransferase